jgi:thioredoxin-related protein
LALAYTRSSMGLRISVFATILLIALLLPVAQMAAQDDGVVVLDEGDFERAPDAAPVGGARTSASATTDGEVLHFDHRRDAKADIRQAVGVAAREGKHVLLEVGGDWCSFCKLLDEFFDTNRDLLAYRRQHFVYVKVNFSEENRNEKALDAYPLIRGFPHFFVLSPTGKLLKSQRVALLGGQSGYSRDRFQRFLRSTAPRRNTQGN